MKSLSRLLLVAAMVGVLLSSFVTAAGAQEDVGYLAAVNGASTDPVLVTAGSEIIADNLEYGTDGAGTTVPAGSYDVAFTGGTIVSGAAVDIAAGSAQTVVSGFGVDPDTAKAYPIDVTPIGDGLAKVTFWNTTGAPVMVTFGGLLPVEVQPGDGIATEVVPADAGLTIDVDGVTRDIATPVDSYTDVFAVDDAQAPMIAVSVIASMTELIIALAPTTPGDVSIPDVVGQPEADASSAITGAGLVVASTEAPNDAVPAGNVVSQDPAAATMVAPGSTVNIVVSTGPDAPATVPVPDVVGQSAEDAQSTLEGAGFTVSATEQPSPDVEAGLVISTNPAGGTEVAPGTEVAIVVSSGAQDVVVPDLTGMSKDDATAAAEAVGLTVTFVEDADNPDPDGVVISQDPAAGTTVAGGSEISAQLSPDLGEPWSIVTLDPNRQMTVTGVGLLPGSTVRLSVIDTSLTESVAVQDDGTWTARFDLSDVENDTEFLLVEGTATDTSDYEATFKIPAAGDSTDVPTDEVVEEESSGFPVWGWVLLGLAVIAIVLLVVRMVTGGSDASSDSSDGSDSTDS